MTTDHDRQIVADTLAWCAMVADQASLDPTCDKSSVEALVRLKTHFERAALEARETAIGEQGNGSE